MKAGDVPRGPQSRAARLAMVAVPLGFFGVFFAYPVATILDRGLGRRGRHNIVDLVTDTLGEFAPELLTTNFAAEMWALFESGELRPDSALSGIHIKDETPADLGQVVLAIEDARREEMLRRERESEADAV